MTRARCGAAAADQSLNLRCTLRNFPHLIDHCIEWARDKFAEVRSTAAGWLARAHRGAHVVSLHQCREDSATEETAAGRIRIVCRLSSSSMTQHDSA
jgi:hypothetical protein